MNPFRLTRTQILSSKNSGGGAQGIKGADQEHADLAACGDGCHGGGAQAVDGRLDQDTADGGDGILHPHGKPHHQKLFYIPALGNKILPAQVENGEFLCHIPQAKQPGNQLCQQRSPAGTGNTHPEAQNKQEIQPHIQQAGKNQKHQRRSGIPQGTENSGEQIVEHRGGDAQENDENIVIGVVKHFLGSSHPSENPAAQDRSDQRHNAGNTHRQPDHIAHKPPQAVKVPLTEFLRHGDGKACADTVAQS